MQPVNDMTFGQFRLDVTNECLWHGTEAIPLRPKAFAVLRHLLEHRGHLVTKRQLLDAVWPATFVTDAVLKASIRQLREALGDDATSPRYIETSHRRGYRFMADMPHDIGRAIAHTDIRDGRRTLAESAARAEVVSHPTPSTGVLGRDREVAKLRTWLERSLQGERQIVFVTGEPGIGKTTLVNALLEHAAAVPDIRIARGQCLEHYGAGEAYLPMLESLSRLGRATCGEQVVSLLRQHAPAWLLQLPSLLPEDQRESLQRQVGGATRDRMLREMGEALEAMTVTAPLILVLEDLHWSDYSTVDLVAYLARRHDPARLMVVGTYRPVDVIVEDHPLKAVKRELQAHGLCRELPLEYLTEEAVGEYLGARLASDRLPRRLARLIHRRSEGNPLFMVNLLDYLIDERLIGEENGEWQLHGDIDEIVSGVPDNIRQLIEKQIERLSLDERRVLEGASVVGMECSTVAIAAGLGEQSAWVEERCEALVRRHQFLSPARLVELPDGTITPRYRFSHILYLEVPYCLLPAMRRSQIHLRIGQSGEAIYQDRVGEIAAELAMHFEQGLDSQRAVKYLAQAAENAIHRSAHHEAAALARRGLQALGSLAETFARDQQEVGLRVMLGMSVMAIKGFAVAEVEAIYRRALELCGRERASPQSFRVQWLLGLFHYFRGEMEPAHQIAERLLELANGLGDPSSVIEAHRACGVTLVDLGRFGQGLVHLDGVSALYERRRHDSYVSFAGQDPKVVSECYAARALWALGRPNEASERVEAALQLARDLAHAESLVIATHFAAHLHQLRGEVSMAQQRAETVIALADDYGLALWSAFGCMNRGWARVEQGYIDEGIRELRRGLAAYEATGAKLWRAHFLGLLAQALGRADRLEEGLATVADALALAHVTGENWSTSELHRIRGELLTMQLAAAGGPTPPEVASSLVAQAKACFREALTIARRQKAKSWELRIAATRGRLDQTQRRQKY